MPGAAGEDLRLNGTHLWSRNRAINYWTIVSRKWLNWHIWRVYGLEKEKRRGQSSESGAIEPGFRAHGQEMAMDDVGLPLQAMELAEAGNILGRAVL